MRDFWLDVLNTTALLVIIVVCLGGAVALMNYAGWL